jgi:dTDP-4-amino-4,6-dideoxygalactose transaminase
LDEYNTQRRYLTRLYTDLLQELTPSITIPFSNYQGISSAHILPILLPEGSDRVHFMEHMKSHGIQTSIHYPPIHQFTAYQEHQRTHKSSLPVTEEVAAREVTLPLYPTLGSEDIETIAITIQKALHHLKQHTAIHQPIAGTPK